MSTYTKSQKLLDRLIREPMSAKAIKSRLGIPNPAATVSYLRQQGNRIVTDDTGAVTKYYAVS